MTTHSPSPRLRLSHAVMARARGAAATRPGTHYLLPAAMLALHLALFLVVFPNSAEDSVLHGNLWLFFRDAGRALTGAAPYRDFLLEYPPGSLLVMMLPRAFAVGFLQFRTLFFVEAAALDAATVLMLWAVARRAALPAWRVLGLYTLAIVLLGPLPAYRLDLAPAALTVLAVLAWQHNRTSLAAVALAAGVATKLYPALLLPLLAMQLWGQEDRRRFWHAIFAGAMTLAILFSPLLLAGSEGLAHAVQYQTGRHLQVESIWAVPVLLLHLTTRLPLEIAARGRALVILGPGDALGSLGVPALLLAALAVYWLWWRLRERRDIHGITLLLATATLTVAAAILSKVLSPQYLIWTLAPLAALPLRRATLVALLAFGAALPLTQWIYPLHYGELVQLITPWTVGVLALRNMLLLLALGGLLVALAQLTVQRTDMDIADPR